MYGIANQDGIVFSSLNGIATAQNPFNSIFGSIFPPVMVSQPALAPQPANTNTNQLNQVAAASTNVVNSVQASGQTALTFAPLPASSSSSTTLLPSRPIQRPPFQPSLPSIFSPSMASSSNQYVVTRPENQCGLSNVTKSRVVGGDITQIGENCLNHFKNNVFLIFAYFCRTISMDRCSRISVSKYILFWNTISMCRIIDNVNARIDNGTLHQWLFVGSGPNECDRTNSHWFSCFFSFRRVLVRLGEFDFSSNHDGATPIDILIEKKIAHENYVNNIISNDIGLLKLRTSAPVNGEPKCNIPLTGRALNFVIIRIHLIILFRTNSTNLFAIVWAIEITRSHRVRTICSWLGINSLSRSAIEFSTRRSSANYFSGRLCAKL